MSFDLKNAKASFSPKENLKARIEGHRIDEHLNSNDQQGKPSSKSVGEILHQWRAPEFEAYEKSGRWYLIFAIFIITMIIYALFANGPIMAITFILLGIVGYIHLQKDPRIVSFSITSKGVTADKEMYLYENIHSFWIFYDPDHTRVISLHTKASMLPFVHIPIRDEDPVAIRELLMQNIPEIKQDPGLIDAIERFLHI